jgi:hypothetical protein
MPIVISLGFDGADHRLRHLLTCATTAQHHYSTILAIKRTQSALRSLCAAPQFHGEILWILWQTGSKNFKG